jgi:hypothetical protein
VAETPSGVDVPGLIPNVAEGAVEGGVARPAEETIHVATTKAASTANERVTNFIQNLPPRDHAHSAKLAGLLTSTHTALSTTYAKTVLQMKEDFYKGQLYPYVAILVRTLRKCTLRHCGDPCNNARPIHRPPRPRRCGNASYAIWWRQARTATEGAGMSAPVTGGRLALGESGTTQFLNNLIDGYQGSINVGDQVAAETGQVNGPTDEVSTPRTSMRDFRSTAP